MHLIVGARLGSIVGAFVVPFPYLTNTHILGGFFEVGLVQDLGTMPLVYSGACGENQKKIEIESARKEMQSYLTGGVVPIAQQITARPRVHLVGRDEIRVTIPKARRLNRISSPKSEGEGERRSDSVARSMRVVYDLIKCNTWDYFCTQTVSPDMLDREDLHGLVSKMSRGVSDQNKRVIHRDKKIKYLWVPELHKDGKSWHLHGVLSGLVEKDLRRNANGFLEWSWSADNVGFFSLSKIRSKEKTASYVRKYITKNVAAGGRELNKQLYYCSQNLERPMILASEDICCSAEMCRDAISGSGYCQHGKWGTVCTLQGESAQKFMDKWGESLEVI